MVERAMVLAPLLVVAAVASKIELPSMTHN